MNTEISDDVALPMLAAMDKAGSMSLTGGKAAAFLVSLAGSARATNDICATPNGDLKSNYTSEEINSTADLAVTANSKL